MVNEKYELVIVGGSAGGYTVALTVKQAHPNVSVLLVRREEFSLVPCSIPYLAATLESCNKNLLAEATLKGAGIETLVDDVSSLDLSVKTVLTGSGKRIGFQKLILATGSIPIVPSSIAGTQLEGVYTIKKEFNAMEQLQRDIRSSSKIVIIGGGFVGVEFADDLSKTGKGVTIVEILPHCLLLNFDEEFAVEAEERLKSKGINLCTNSKVVRMVGDGKVKAVELADGQRLDADVVILTIGGRPNVELATKAGLRTGELGGLAVDGYMRTSHLDVFAVGDCAEKKSSLTGKPVPLMLASVACQEARVAGLNLFEIKVPRPMGGVLGIYLTYVGGKAFGAAGLTESMAKKESYDIETSVAKVLDKHPGSLPKAEEISLKLIYAKNSGLLIGAEVSGGSSVAELINLLGLAIQSRATVSDLSLLQYGTQPLLTASPVFYPAVVAALKATISKNF